MKKRLFSLVLVIVILAGFYSGMTITVDAVNTDYYWTEESWGRSGQPETNLTIFHDSEKYYHYGLKDSTGKIVLPAEYDELRYAGGDRIIARHLGSSYGIITTNGTVIYPFTTGTHSINVYDEENPAFVIKKIDPKKEPSLAMYGYSCGLYDWNGKEIIPIKYDRLNYLGDGYYLIGDKSFGVFKQGVGMIIPEQYRAIEYLGQDLFSVLNTNRLCGVVDSHNKQIMPFTYEYIFHYKQGYFIVGQFKEPEHREAYYNFGFLQNYQMEFLAGLADRDGNLLLPMECDDIIINDDATYSIGTINGTKLVGHVGGVPVFRYTYAYETYPLSDLLRDGNTTTTPSTVGDFTDVKSDDYYADAVLWAVEKNITSGTSKTTFSPGATCSKAQILTFLWRANGSPDPTAANPFNDIKTTDYFYKAALWASEKGLVSGSTFDANTDCTRAMTMDYMWKAAGSPAASYNGKFNDVPASADYAQAVAWAVEQKITSGTGSSNFSPAATCTRGQIVTFLHRAMGK